MNEYKKPLPQPTPWSKPFWDGCKKRKLLIQQCKSCKKYIFYPKLFCPFCLSPDLAWAEATGRGKIYSYTIVHSYQPSEFSEDVPYVVAVIELDEGVQMMSNIVDCKPDEIRCDMKVEVVFDKINEKFSLPKFKLVY